MYIHTYRCVSLSLHLSLSLSLSVYIHIYMEEPGVPEVRPAVGAPRRRVHAPGAIIIIIITSITIIIVKLVLTIITSITITIIISRGGRGERGRARARLGRPPVGPGLRPARRGARLEGPVILLN